MIHFNVKCKVNIKLISNIALEIENSTKTSYFKVKQNENTTNSMTTNSMTTNSMK